MSAVRGFCFSVFTLGFVIVGSASAADSVPSETGSAMIAPEFSELDGKISDLLPAPPAGTEWRLLWHDEFDGTAIDLKEKWETPEFGVRRDGYWAPEALSLTGDGFLKMSVFKDESGRFLSGCLRSRGKYEKAKGFFVARMNSPHETGHWPAFWLYTPEINNIGNGSADGAEIDIMEKPWLEDKVNLAVHWDGYLKHHQTVSFVPTLGPSADGFHTYALWWGDDAYRFYIDGEKVWETTAGGICQVPTFIKFSDEVGRWGGDIGQANLPDETLVDYVRVYDLFPTGAEPSAE